VEDKSIESSVQGIQRNTEFDEKDKPEQRAKKQFVLRQSWEVSVPSQAAAEVIRVSIAEGANKSGAIDWRLSDRKALQAKAAEAALVKAREVASKMADGMHVKLGPLIYASNETPSTRLFSSEMSDIITAKDLNTLTSLTRLPTLEIRSQTIREQATVYAVFAIE
jgi:hypothetical protein